MRKKTKTTSTPRKNPQGFDIIIIGAGPAGLSFATLMAPSGLRIALIEKQSAAALKNPAYDGREIALTHLSHKIMTECGMWDRIPARDISLIKDAKVLNGGLTSPLSFDHTETGKPNLGYMVSNHLIRRAAYDSTKTFKNITLLCGREVVDARVNGAHGFVTLDDRRTLTAPLLVVADSRFSNTRDLLGMPVDAHHFKRTCIVCRMDHTQTHADTAYECFFYDRTMAVLPLNHGKCSVVITVDSPKADQILNMTPAEFSRDMTARMARKFGTMTLDGKLFAYPLVATYARRFYRQRTVLLGDAAVGMHPVTAHGFNFGLRGAHVLAYEIQNALDVGLDYGSVGVLRRYHDAHVHATKVMYHGTNAIVKIFTTDTPLARVVRKTMLRLGDFPLAKRAIMNKLTEIRA